MEDELVANIRELQEAINSQDTSKAIEKIKQIKKSNLSFVVQVTNNSMGQQVREKIIEYYKEYHRSEDYQNRDQKCDKEEWANNLIDLGADKELAIILSEASSSLKEAKRKFKRHLKGKQDIGN